MFFQKAEWDVKKLLDDNLCLIILQFYVATLTFACFSLQ